MMLRLLLLPALLLLLSIADALRVNGWYPCTATTTPSDVSSALLFATAHFECAKIQVPLCHPGICNSSQTTEVFVKRMLATAQPATKTVWFLEGGPGASSTNMETMMLILSSLLNHTANVYTMDHRGTGRSGFLQCEAAQALADGSPGGAELELTELADCMRDVIVEIDGHTAAYSVTSAARDVVALLAYLEEIAEDPQEDSTVFLYGVSYGTYLVERVMHLAPPQVKGYMLDGVLSESNFSAIEWNKNIAPPTTRYLEACFDSPKCPLKFKSKETVIEEVLKMYESIDAAMETNACASGLSLLLDEPTPSHALRFLFTLLVRDPAWRTLIPSLLLRVRRCNSKDLDELHLVYAVLEKRMESQYGKAASSPHAWSIPTIPRPQTTWKPTLLDPNPTSTMSSMLYFLITFSELWQLPMPDLASLEDDFLHGPFALNVETLPAYCIVSGGFNTPTNKSTTCGELRQALEEDGEDLSQIPSIKTPFLYPHDQYWNKTATLPNDVGALFIVGGLDFQTPSELGKRQFEALKAEKKMLVEFEFGGHGAGFLPTTGDDLTLCGPTILASFIENNGDVTKVDTACMENMPNLDFDDHAFGELITEIKAAVVEAQGDEMDE